MPAVQTHLFASVATLVVVAAAALIGPVAAMGADTSAAAAPADVEAALSRFHAAHMPFDAAVLSPREKQLVNRLVEATRLLDELFWEQSDPDGLALYRSLAGSKIPADQALRRLLLINGGRYDLIREYAPFAGAGPRPPGGSLYPADLTRAELDAFVAKHPDRKTALYSPFTVIRRHGTQLVAIPYHVAYRKWLEPMATALRAAADLADDAAFAAFLRQRAEALLTDDYFQSDLAWLELVNPRIDIIFAPYETYLDHFLGVKTSYGASVLVRDDAESKKLDQFQAYVPDIQDALPLKPADRPSKHGHRSPMEVMDAPFRGGDLRHGYQAVADNLPNDPRVHEQKGSKKIFFKNFMHARVNYVILPIARRLMRPDQVGLATADGYMTTTLMHEISHGLGPSFSRTAAGQRDIREAIGPAFGGLEEAKADIVGLYALKWLADHGKFPAAKLAECYVSAVAGMFRTVRFGVAEAHGSAEIMEFNFLAERGVITLERDSGRYAVDVARMPGAVAALAKELLEQEAAGDRARVETWFAKYGTMPPQLAQSLEAVRDLPVDVDPTWDFAEL
jgi:Peptidase family M49